MDNFSLMQVVESTQDVVNDRLDLGLLKMFTRFDELLEVHIALTQHKIDFIESQIFDGSFSIALNISGRNDS